MYSFGRFKKIGLLIIILLGITLFFIDPEYSAFIPKCRFVGSPGLIVPLVVAKERFINCCT